MTHALYLAGFKNDKKGLSLILISSVLLGIWATMNTIALRNILLVLGTIISILYWIDSAKAYKGQVSKEKDQRLGWLDWMPFILIALMFVWVVMHYLFFSREPQRQWDELTSTWLRSLLAAIIGSATGLALQRHKQYAWALYLGLIVSFLVLIYQYIPKAIQKKSLFATDWYGNYIYWAKFSGVLAGTLLIAGLLGLLIDSIRGGGLVSQLTEGQSRSSNPESGLLKTAKRTKGIFYWISIYVLFGIALVFYAFVFVFDAKAGVGMAVILIGFWFALGIVYGLLNANQFSKNVAYRGVYIKTILFLLLIGSAMAWFSMQHIKNNPGWESLFKDVALSAKIDQYPNWQDPPRYGFPKHEDGQEVRSNTYERVSMAVAGLQVIEKDPIGHGVLRSFTQQIKGYYPEYKSHPYTHSAWIDLGLSFGWPGLLLIPTILFIVLIRMIRQQSSPCRATVTSVCLTMLILYTVGEYGFQHGIEILFFMTALVSGLAISRTDRHQSSN
jgi:hypothetical protein